MLVCDKEVVLTYVPIPGYPTQLRRGYECFEVAHLVVMLVKPIVPIQQTINFQNIAVGISAFPCVNTASALGLHESHLRIYCRCRQSKG